MNEKPSIFSLLLNGNGINFLHSGDVRRNVSWKPNMG